MVEIIHPKLTWSGSFSCRRGFEALPITGWHCIALYQVKTGAREMESSYIYLFTDVGQLADFLSAAAMRPEEFGVSNP